MKRSPYGMFVLAASISMGIFVAGCLPWKAGPESVLAGTWKLAVDNPTVVDEGLVTFDLFGNLTSLSVTVNGQTITLGDIDAETRVEGADVTITASFTGGTIELAGALNESENEIDGALSLTLAIGGLDAVPLLEAQPATLARLLEL